MKKKTAADLIGDPLYQTNLVLWMLQPSTGVPVRPVLYDAGFRLRDIERELPLPIALSASLKDDAIPCSNPVTPDVILKNSDRQFVAMECKATMFGSEAHGGSDGSQIRQARSLLLQVPAVLAEGLALQAIDVLASNVIYLSRYDPIIDQTEGLSEIAASLNDRAYATSPFGLLGLVVSSGSVAIRTAGTNGTLPGLLNAHITSAAVAIQDSASDDEDPRPLYFLPWMPGSAGAEDEYSHAAFGNRVLMAATAVIGRLSPPCAAELETDSILRAATQGHYDNWHNKAVIRQLREQTRKLLREQLTRSVSSVIFSRLAAPGGGWRVEIPDSDTKQRLIEGFRKWQENRWNVPLTPGLFDDEEDV
jgi:hypothetical protein